MSNDVREALEWYGEQARLCRKITSEGDAGRHALHADGGKRARAALAQPQPAAAAVADGLRALALDWRTEAHHTDDHQDEAWTAINNTLRRCADDVLALLATPAPQAQAEAGAQSGVKWPVTSDICLAGRDGDCNWPQCPQERDGEPHATGRHCPLDNRTEEGS